MALLQLIDAPFLLSKVLGPVSTPSPDPLPPGGQGGQTRGARATVVQRKPPGGLVPGAKSAGAESRQSGQNDYWAMVAMPQ
jgi:hypothetical protein